MSVIFLVAISRAKQASSLFLHRVYVFMDAHDVLRQIHGWLQACVVYKM